MNPITSVVIPDSVTSIGDQAFRMNDISSLTLGNSVQSIGFFAFQLNRLISVNIPNSVTTIDPTAFSLNSSIGYMAMVDAIESGDPVQVQQAYDAICVVRLYTEDPSNPNNLQDSIITEVELGGDDLNDNGRLTDVLGGHLINPSEDEGGSSGGDGSSDSEDTLASTGQNSVAVKAFAASMVLLSLALPVKKLITKRDDACRI